MSDVTASADHQPEIVETAKGPVELRRYGSGPAVLVVHGTPGGGDQAAAMGAFLAAAGFTVLAPSRPGYLGTPLGELTTVDDQADLHAALLDALGETKVGVLAWSGGGPSAYRLAVRHPERVGALVVAAGVSGPFAPGTVGIDERLMMDTKAGNWVLRLMAKHAPDSTIGATLKAEGDLSKAELKALTAEAVSDPDERALVLAMAAAASDHAHRADGIDNDLARFGELGSLELERIACPVLIVGGDADTDVSPTHCDHAAATIPGAERIVLDRGTHLALWVHPEAKGAQERAIGTLRRAQG